MKNKISFTRLSVVLGLALCAVIAMTYQNVATASEVQLVKIFDVAEGGLKLDPPKIKIHKKGIVIWSNGVESGQVQVVFKDGKTCQDIVSNPAGSFNLNPQSCFVTTYMPYGATSSLVFPEVGEFEYKVISEDGKLKTKGTIHVIK